MACSLLAAAFAPAGCSVTEPSSTYTSQSPGGATGDTVIAASDRTLETAGIAYYAVHADGSGTAFSPDGSAIATFRTSWDGSRSSFDLLAGGPALHLDFTMSRGADGSVTIEGTANGQALSIAVANDGHVIRQSGPKLDDRLRPILEGLNNDFTADAAAHEVSAGRCALGVAILAGSIALAFFGNPAWVLSGALSAYGGCSG